MATLSRFRVLGAVWATVVGTGLGCGEQQDDSTKEVPLREARRIVIEIDAMPRAMPSFAPLDNGYSPWVVFEHNLQRLASPAIEGLTLARSEWDVGLLEGNYGGRYSEEEILELAERHRDLEVGAHEAHFHVLFLDGEYEKNTQQNRVRALHLGGTRIIAIFGAVPPYASDYERIAEQSALLHEMGHAFGLVDLGMPKISDHSDHDSPRHCNESDCIMGAYSIFPSQARHFLQGGPVPLLFGPRCMEDVSAYYE